VLELMDDTTTLGAYLRAERESRDLTLRTISESTKVSLPLLEGLESDDISRWPGGIFRRAFVRSYAEAVGLDPDEIFRRFERQYKPVVPDVALDVAQPPAEIVALALATGVHRASAALSSRARYVGTAADMAVALVLAFGSAAAGSRLLWPVLLIAAYYAAGVLLTGTSPMVALLGDPSPSRPQTASDRLVASAATAHDDNVDNVDSMLGHSSPGAIS
jgi:transcriptional regulator with XRE-family HTH domain